jgi:hypothetical protein
VCERGSFILNFRIGTFPKTDQILASTVKAVAMRNELEACEDTPDLGKMIRVFGANQEMNVNEA